MHTLKVQDVGTGTGCWHDSKWLGFAGLDTLQTRFNRKVLVAWSYRWSACSWLLTLKTPLPKPSTVWQRFVRGKEQGQERRAVPVCQVTEARLLGTLSWDQDLQAPFRVGVSAAGYSFSMDFQFFRSFSHRQVTCISSPPCRSRSDATWHQGQSEPCKYPSKPVPHWKSSPARAEMEDQHNIN